MFLDEIKRKIKKNEADVLIQPWKKGIILRLFIVGMLPVTAHHGIRLYISNTYNPRLLSAIEHDDVAAAHVALTAGADPNTRYGSGIPRCLEFFDTSVIDSNLPSRETNKATVLMEAASRGQAGVVADLLEHGAVVEAEDRIGDTALSWVAAHMNPTVVSQQSMSATVKKLVGHGAQIGHENSYKCSPWIWASIVGNTSVARMLLELGADVNKQDDMKRTALIWAVYNKHPDTVRFLLESGANVNLQDEQGKTALAYAKGNKILTEILTKQIKY